MTNITKKAGFVAIIGAPNAGKSTFLNSCIGEKVAIVSPKEQTTRFNIRAVLTQDEAQFIFVDTPGIHKARRMFDEAMVNTAVEASLNADTILFLVDVKKGLTEEVLEIIEHLKQVNTPKIFAFNKCDLIKDKNELLPKLNEIKELYKNVFDDYVIISAWKNQGTEDVLKVIAKHLPESEFLYSEDYLTDLPMKLVASEETREKAFMLLKKEIPYSVMVETLEYKENPKDGSIRIEQILMLERESHKKIVVGNKGQVIKKIGMLSRQSLEKFLGVKVHLFLKVKVQPNWAVDNFYYKMLGLAKPKNSEHDKHKKPKRKKR
ncbi:MAG: GTPase Era [Proteobacteria bacterium]|nr:GTPase Era [Pseudomonadota bacterium]